MSLGQYILFTTKGNICKFDKTMRLWHIPLKIYSRNSGNQYGEIVYPHYGSKVVKMGARITFRYPFLVHTMFVTFAKLRKIKSLLQPNTKNEKE
jgi:hypothetical protein